MSVNDKSLTEQRQFWKTVFEEKKLASQLATLASNKADDGWVLFNIPPYGEVHVKSEAGSTLGDNFMSDTYILKARVNLSNTTGINNTAVYSTFIKILPSNIMLRQAAHEANVHQREMDMYTQFFELLRGINAKHPHIVLDVPEVYYVYYEKNVEGVTDGSNDTCILLEDLREQGYRMVDKANGPDLKHCEMALTALAHYHALTIKFLKQWTNPVTGKLSNLPPSAAFVKEKTILDDRIVQMAKEWAPPLIDFAKDIKRPDLEKWLTDLINRLLENTVVDAIDSPFPLMCFAHGDFWTNNMLFKYATEKENGKKGQEVPVAMKMIDFQLSRIGHPLNDILYYMYSSVSPEIREKHMRNLLKMYFDILMEDLKTLGVKIEGYEWKHFLEDYKKRSILWMFLGGMVMNTVLNKKVLSNLNEINEKELKPEKEVKEKNVSDTPFDLEESLKKLMGGNRMSEGPPLLKHRLLKLITEVKALNSSFDVTPVDYWPLK